MKVVKKRMPGVREYVLNSLGESVDMLPGFSHQTLLVSTALTESRQDAGASHPLFGVDPIMVFAALISCFCVTRFLQSKY